MKSSDAVSVPSFPIQSRFCLRLTFARKFRWNPLDPIPWTVCEYIHLAHAVDRYPGLDSSSHFKTKQTAGSSQSLTSTSSLAITVGTKTQILNCNLSSNENEMRGS